MFQSLLETYERNLPTKVLLVCTYNINGRLITHDVYYKLFSQYRQINKILIFEKAKVWKTFIEFEDIQQAIIAKDMLNNYILFPDGSQIQVFYSNINQLQFKTFLNYNGVDYKNLRNNYQLQQQQIQQKQQFSQASNHLKKQLSKDCAEPQQSKSCQANQSTKSSFSDLNLSQQEIPTTSYHLLMNEQTTTIATNNILDENSNSQKQQDTYNNIQQVFEQNLTLNNTEKSNPFQLFTDKNSPLKFLNQVLQEGKSENNINNNCNYQRSCSIKASSYKSTNNDNNISNFSKQISNLNLNFNTQFNVQLSPISGLNQQDKPQSIFNENANNEMMNNYQQQSNFSQEESQDENMQEQINNYINPLFLMQNQQSSVLFLRDIVLDENSIKLLYKIFNNFGNVFEIVYIKNKRQALIEFENVQHASLAKDFLYAKFFIGKKLKIFFSNYQSLTQRTKKNDNSEIYLKGQVEDYRYKANIDTKQINAPTNYIHLANIPPQIYTNEALASLFSKFGIIEDIQLIQKNIKNMCVIKFSNVQESMSAFDMHNSYYFGRRLVLSFTRIKF